MADVRITHELTSAQIDDLVELYQTAWWSIGRVRTDVEPMLRGCLPCGLVDGRGRLIGFARAITDGVYKALVCDVIVAETHRGEGLGERLIDTLLGHPLLAHVPHVELYCLPALIPFYERWGFSRELGDVTFMRLQRSATSVSRTGGTAA